MSFRSEQHYRLILTREFRAYEPQAYKVTRDEITKFDFTPGQNPARLLCEVRINLDLRILAREAVSKKCVSERHQHRPVARRAGAVAAWGAVVEGCGLPSGGTAAGRFCAVGRSMHKPREHHVASLCAPILRCAQTDCVAGIVDGIGQHTVTAETISMSIRSTS
jgi:hypothetical protein